MNKQTLGETAHGSSVALQQAKGKQKSHSKGKPGSPDEEKLWYTQDKITELKSLGSWCPPLA